MPWQQAGEKIQRPFFHGLGQQGVIGVTERPAGNIPGLVPIQVMDIHQQPHQLRYGNRRMCIVKLGLKVLIKIIQAVIYEQMDSNHVLHGAGDKKILLFQPQFFALELFIIGIQYLGNIFSGHFFLNRAEIIAHIKVFKIEGFGRLGAPEA